MISELLSQLDEPFTGEALFDHLSDSVFFIKNTEGKYLVVNQTFVERCGVRDKQDVLGYTAEQLMRPPLGARFTAQDQQVLRTGRPLLSQLELHLYSSGTVGWCMTTKLPLKGQGGKVIGLVGISQDLRLPNYDTDEYGHIATALEFAEKNLSSPPSVDELAVIAKMSRYQLDRRMRRIFGLTVGQWLMKARIDLAQRLLSDTELPIATIALEAGYSDQSAFTRQFRVATGLSPREYRSVRDQG
ncbi:AraC family transcriptional regulator [Aporhodopirellula aestuarii]|uniref:AraC family transcriptional regulator n=1 Tax=Aporhodopirellula aestuarii TaxID=2950107 RepID=A0ABT0TWZ6_9BACT|nr:AraC family transcriptional regulator [Aporhodopirellula aestuarii]MCM2369132.1 AraC family transcriptional regulator [Aporhodopirellula aestuarii]